MLSAAGQNGDGSLLYIRDYHAALYSGKGGELATAYNTMSWIYLCTVRAAREGAFYSTPLVAQYIVDEEKSSNRRRQTKANSEAHE